MSLKSFFKKKTSSQKKILQEVEMEATEAERKKIKIALAAEQKQKQAEDKKRSAAVFERRGSRKGQRH